MLCLEPWALSRRRRRTRCTLWWTLPLMTRKKNGSRKLLGMHVVVDLAAEEAEEEGLPEVPGHPYVEVEKKAAMFQSAADG